MPLIEYEVVRLQYHDMLHDRNHNNWRVNGKPKIWATGRFQVPIKYGMRGFGYVTEQNYEDYHKASECPYLIYEGMTKKEFEHVQER